MPDLIKTIKSLEDYEPYARHFRGITVEGSVILDALELLKEQEPVKPVKEQIFSSIFGLVCGACNFPLLSDSYMYCPRCGKKVKWE